MKRLLCIVGSMNAGGAETFLMKIYRKLDRTKYQMDFCVAVSDEGLYDKEIQSMGGRMFHISPKSQGLLKNFNDIKRIVRENNYKYVLRTSQHSLSALELFAAQLGGAKVRVFRSSNSNTVSGSRKQMMLHRMFMFMPKFFANVKIAPSTEAAEFMFGKGCIEKGKASLIHNGLDLDVYHFSEEARAEIRNELGIADELVVGHVGRFNQQKNHDFLIDVFYELLKIQPKSILVLVGVGELQESIRKKVNDYGISKEVRFLGVRSDVPRLLSGFDVFLFPSLYEGMPNTVIEAQATGLPCVISDSITKEADITGLVKYVSLRQTSKDWAKILFLASQNARCNICDNIKKNAYDIESVAMEFRTKIFES